jgi:inner membrane protein
MDPITQGALGAAAATALFANRKELKTWQLGTIGWLSGMAADLDIIIRSSTDTLLAIEYHRHFTHSLAFIPVGAVIAALPWFLSKQCRTHWKWVYLISLVAYATHGLLDACTTYGTQLFWPFSNQRVSLSVVSIIDPLATLPLLGFLFLALKKKSRRLAILGCGWFLAVLSLGGIQKQKATQVQLAIAEQRNHTVERSAVLPMFANNISFRSLYLSNGQYYIDKIRVPWGGEHCVTPGVHAPILSTTQKKKFENQDARAYRLIDWFANGWTILDANSPDLIADLRYSFSPTQSETIWGVQFSDSQASIWVNNVGQRKVSWDLLYQLIFENGENAICF